MKSQTNTSKSRAQFGLFLFFLAGLFALQIAFAFTIHGDIGPQTNIVPGIEKPASPILVGRIDSLISNARLIAPAKVAPEGAFAPATRDFSDSKLELARIETEDSNADHSTEVIEADSERFVAYRVQSGDTLEKIARKLFGSSQMVQSLVRINRITDERCLRLGSTIKVPRSGLLQTVKIN
ncbi:MAG: LysM peptidoglycan-binding domain-containing protein [Candidatus Riflebacteria bacterium]|nr:LysM peptidoglycan-binding domain-containing protein [Candidatus Riflebacteria bacterium]